MGDVYIPQGRDFPETEIGADNIVTRSSRCRLSTEGSSLEIIKF